MSEDDSITIEATRASPPTCRVTYRHQELVLDCAAVRRLAEAMHAAAARAEAEAAAAGVFRELQLGEEIVSGMLLGLRSRYEKHGFGIKGTLTFVPGVSVFDAAPFVHLNLLGGRAVRIDPAVLRGMAAQWLACAEAAERDVILLYALAEATDLTPDQVEEVYRVMRNVRPTGLRDQEATDA
ncbi:hypothetical protein [Streptomonospora litoralis]|uniref:Uncharacterized protein n=1 Tax=Streptomonospora litoralis TaxID=2498135 RepID=A0A4P6PYY2_9ACTN|nr:hypothetical protein [Streptomonospora litoralis]QBI53458.1 hypothetical protein EKD16_08320 [Streptomonospora litoralis]